MTDFRERYKRLGFGREDVDVSRALRSQRHNNERREKRSEFYGARRDLHQDDSLEIEEKKEQLAAAAAAAVTASNHGEAEKKVEEKIDEACLNRLKQLEKWREERNRRRLLEKKVAKPVFKVGVVHHRMYSPPIKKKEASSPPTRLCRHKENVPERPPKRITKATKKRLQMKAVTNTQKRENMRSTKKKETVEKASLAPKDHQFKAPTGVNAIPLFGRRALEPPQENVKLELTNNCFPSKPVNVSSLCKSISEFTLSLLESSSLPQSQSNKALNGKNDEVDQENEEKCEDMDVEEHTPQAVNRRRSTRILNDSMIKKPQSPKTRRIRVNFNLLDSSLSNLHENGSPIARRTTRFSKMIQNGIDQSLIKFSPRQSMRLAKEAAKSLLSKETVKSSESEEITKLKSPENFVKSSPSDETRKSLRSEQTVKSSPSKDSAKSSPFTETANTSFNKTLSPEKPPAFYSPFVVASRGKSSARKEIQKTRKSLVASEDIPTKDTVMKNLNISIEEEERTAQYYKYLLNQEIGRLNELCDSWEVVKNDESTPEDIHYLIQAAIGQTRLLINKKFKRFQSLVQDCETGKGEMLVTCKDLQGFWEMTFIEVENCNDRFKKLEELKANNWVDEEARKLEEKLKKKPAIKKSAAIKKKPAVGKASSMRALILAARKKLQNPNEDEQMEEPKIQKQEDNEPAVDDNAEKTSIRTSRRISTPNKSLLRVVQLSQTQKSMKSPLITMKINKMCKTPEVQLDDSIIYINSDRTPARSILKSCKDDISITSAVKTVNKVLFKEQPMEIQLFDTDLENLENVNDNYSAASKRLSFEESFNEDEDDNEKKDNNDKQIAKSKSNVNNDSPVGSKSEFRKELYLNSQGIVSERLIPVIEDTPSTSKLKKKRSTISEETCDLHTELVDLATPNNQNQKTRNSKKLAEIQNSSRETVTLSTPSYQRRRHSKFVENLDLSVAEPTTPNRQRRRNSKKQLENQDLSTVEIATPNSQRRSLRIRKLQDKN